MSAVSNQTKQVSQDELHYYKFIIYLKCGFPVCDSLANEVSSHLDILVQDVDKIENVPDWLKGVPTVVKLPANEVVRGTEAIRCIQEYCDQSVKGIPENYGKSNAVTIEGTVMRSGFDSLFQSVDTDDADVRYLDSNKEKKQDTSLEDLLRQRET